MNNTGKKNTKFNPFYHNGFVMGFSILTAIVIWFAMSYTEASEKMPRKMQEVPIKINISERAQNDGLAIFSQTQDTADISVTGNTSVINNLTADDFIVEANFNPDSTKVTGTALQTDKLTLKVQKTHPFKDFQISSVTPTEISVQYDRVKKITLPIENEVKYQLDSGFYGSPPSFSENEVIISGPESVVNKIKRAVVSHEVKDVVKQDVAFNSKITLYGEENAPIDEASQKYLELSTKNVDVSIVALPKKTVPLELNLLNRPESFADSRITIEPATIEIAGSADKLSAIDKFYLESQPIDFKTISTAQRTFTLEIPETADIKNISGVDSVEVSFNLNGYKEAKFTVTNIKLINVPAGLNPELVTKSLSVSVIGSEAQINKLTKDSIYATVNLENINTKTGSMEVPVSVQINGANSCWVIGNDYAVTVNMDAAALGAAVRMDDAEGAVATVQTESR